jgi:hypothetical protein
VSPELHARIQLELSLIEKEVEILELLMKKSRNAEMDSIDCRATAACLHSSYNGYEKIFIMLARNEGIVINADHKWHKNLLDIIGSRFFSQSLVEDLAKLLGFRHFFRHAYSFSLKWENMEPLIQILIGNVHPKIKDYFR